MSSDVLISDRAHAVLSASGSGLWLKCAAAANLNEVFIDEESEYSAEGTQAHELHEAILHARLAGTEYLVPEEYPTDMFEFVLESANRIVDIVQDLRDRRIPHEVIVERRVDFSDIVPEGFGRSDCIIVTNERVWAIDLKYGKGIQVFAEDNSQAMLYCIGALKEVGFVYDGVKELTAVIHQPRLNHYDEWTISREQLEAWGEAIKPIAHKAFHLHEPTPADFTPGDHCNKYFCKARFTCAARSRWAIWLAQGRGLLLTDAEIAALLPNLPGIEKWAKDVMAKSLERAVNEGVRFPGHKLVAGRSNRYITDQDRALFLLKKAGHEPDDVLKDPELRGITELETLLGKKEFETVLADVVAKASGKPVLVPDSDKRAEWRPTTSADDDFA